MFRQPRSNCPAAPVFTEEEDGEEEVEGQPEEHSLWCPEKAAVEQAQVRGARRREKRGEK